MALSGEFLYIFRCWNFFFAWIHFDTLSSSGIFTAIYSDSPRVNSVLLYVRPEVFHDVSVMYDRCSSGICLMPDKCASGICLMYEPHCLNIHIHPFGIVNPKNHCYLNSVIQLLLPILRTISYDFQFNSSTEGTLSKYMLETAYNAYSSTDVDVLKFQLVQYNQFYDGKNQQDSSECLLMLIEIINKGSVPYYGSHVSNSTGVSLSDILFSFMLEKYIVCNVCGLRSPSIESSGVLYISPTHTSSMQELIMQGLQQKLEKSCFRCNKNTWHVESNHILQPPNYLIIVVNRFRYINNQFAKDKCSIPMDMTVVLGYHKFSLQATIDHHGPSIYSGHYTTSVNCCNRTFYCNDNKITEFNMINTKNSSTAYVVIYKLIT